MKARRQIEHKRNGPNTGDKALFHFQNESRNDSRRHLIEYNLFTAGLTVRIVQIELNCI